MQLRVVLLATVCIVLLALSNQPPLAWPAAAGGAIAGALLALYGLQRTRFAVTEAGRTYTPNPYIGLGVTLLFVGRLATRARVLVPAMAADGTVPLAPQRSALTIGLYFLLAAYYIGYSIGVLRTPDSRWSTSVR
jgi:hypothetical protein